MVVGSVVSGLWLTLGGGVVVAVQVGFLCFWWGLVVDFDFLGFVVGGLFGLLEVV